MGILRNSAGRKDARTGAALAALALIWCMATGAVLALPEGGVIVHGGGSLPNPAKPGTVTQTTDKMIIEWNSFSIGEGETLTFNQPSADAIALNRVTGNARSEILGNLVANGRVFLINPRGILFGPNAKVDVASLLATTHTLSNEDFLAGRLNLKGPVLPGNEPLGEVINEGEITVTDGGYAILLGRAVANSGTIKAMRGVAALMAGWDYSLRFNEDGMLEFDESFLSNFARGVTNTGVILADGGMALLKGTVWGTLNYTTEQRQVVNSEGVIRAASLDEREGRIFLNAAGGIAVLKDGSTVEGDHVAIEGQRIHMNPGATINASHLGMSATSELVMSGLARINMRALNGESSVSMHGGQTLQIEGELEWQSVPDQARIFLGASQSVVIDNAQGVSALAFENSELTIEAPVIETAAASRIGAHKVTLKSENGERIDLGGFVETSELNIHFGGDVDSITISKFAGYGNDHTLRLFGGSGPGSTLTVGKFEIGEKPTHLHLAGRAHFGGQFVVATSGDLVVEDYAANVPSTFSSDARIALSAGRAFKNHASLDNVLFAGETPVLIFSRFDTFGYTPGALTFPEQYGFEFEEGEDLLSSLDHLSPNTIYIQAGTPSPVLEITAKSHGTAVYSGALPELDPAELAIVPAVLDGPDPMLYDLRLRLEGGTGGSGADADTYRLVPSAASPNYRLTYTPGVFTITPKEITYATDSHVRIFGDPNPELTGNVSGLVAGQTMLAAGLSFHTDATQFSDAGTYPIVLVQDRDHPMARNYVINHAGSSPGTLTVDRATIQFVVTDRTKVYGDPVPMSRVIDIVGLRGGERADALILQAGLIAIPPVDITADVGVYPWQVVVANPNAFVPGGPLRNYRLDEETPVLGSLTVTQRPLVIAGNIVYSEVLPMLPKSLIEVYGEIWGYYPTPSVIVEGLAPFHSVEDLLPHMQIPRPFVNDYRTVGDHYIYPELDMDAPIFANYFVFVTPATLRLIPSGDLQYYIEEGSRILQRMVEQVPVSRFCVGSCLSRPRVTLAGFPVESWPILARAIVNEAGTFGSQFVTQRSVFGWLYNLVDEERRYFYLPSLADELLSEAQRIVKSKPGGNFDAAEQAFFSGLKEWLREYRIKVAEAQYNKNRSEKTLGGGVENVSNFMFALFDFETDYGDYYEQKLNEARKPISDEELLRVIRESPEELLRALETVGVRFI